MNGLIIFTRYPEPGKTKTRLIPVLGAKGAATVQRQMTEHTLKQARCLSDLALQVYFTGGNTTLMREWLGADLRYKPQCQGDLGQRMAEAFRQAFQEGQARILLIGIDCPGVTPLILNQGFTALHDHDLVIGPAQDGGYYLIGLNRLIPELFEGVAWGTDRVFAQTWETAQGLGYAIATLPQLPDIDEPQDLPLWEQPIPPQR
ncbi:TIGR04282 family arsenosugar biosynthesis glycosyltransferase [Spirulina subsalsa FACHB-351]|uniref:TIGR04282 family arsenosugar biosynthesis glycosyltransferase n=1 Tax=Spirulina subsalsa FACHB-351 TaxID=234711 RepID=A0ABT3LAP6_9CYAN|nr:TIGR04282 family arsenosugar biosynthesis glycosyltransferase [Spirulina subsalsa]MCW6038584.1 TIGR04282 family arsenosugar biosynthesis glycosyltransferase [Spirulina subsalsa FACHB-351]